MCNRCGKKQTAGTSPFTQLTFVDGKERVYCQQCYTMLIALLDHEQATGRLASVKITPLE